MKKILLSFFAFLLMAVTAFAQGNLLANGDFAIGMFNFGDRPAEMSLQFWDIGLSTAAGVGLEMYDCWSHENVGKFSERFVTTVDTHDCFVFRAKVVKL